MGGRRVRVRSLGASTFILLLFSNSDRNCEAVKKEKEKKWRARLGSRALLRLQQLRRGLVPLFVIVAARPHVAGLRSLAGARRVEAVVEGGGGFCGEGLRRQWLGALA